MTDLQVPVARVRRAVLADADALADLAQLTFPLACPPGIDPRDVEDFCRNKIAWFKIPKYVHFVDGYPQTASGKIQKYKLREQSKALVAQRRADGA